MKRNTKFFSKYLIISTIVLPITLLSTCSIATLTSCSKEKVKNTKITVTANADSKLQYKILSTHINPNIVYSLNRGNTWTILNKDASIDIPKGSQLWLKGNNPSGISLGEFEYANLKFTGDVSLSGSIMQLLGDNVDMSTPHTFVNLFRDSTGITSVDEDFLFSTKLTDYCYAHLFHGCTKLKYSPKLPATTLTDSCYAYMFSGCSSLQEIPALPAGTLVRNCYFSMFQGCTSLKTITSDRLKFNTTDEACCQYMFSECSNISTIDDNIFPINNVSPLCYSSMFSKCSSLTSAPKIINDKLSWGCYAKMFEYCIMLSSIPQELLNSTKLAEECYKGMFCGCDHLSDIVLTLPATKTYPACYSNMFQDCSALTRLPSIKATTLAPSCFYEMFSGCKSLTDLSNLKLEYENALGYCFCGMFSSCTNLNKLPVLKITNLADHCFEAMFNNCENITSIPNNYLPNTTLDDGCYTQMFGGTGITTIPSNLLPSTQLKNECYKMMFLGCSKLNSIPNNLLPATQLDEHCYDNMFSHCDSLTSASNLILPAQEMKPYCYNAMFQSCSKLANQPSLQNVTILDEGCFQSMFDSTAITSVQPLPLTQLVGHCYDTMYFNCDMLTNLSTFVLPAGEITEGAYMGMFQGCDNLETPPDLTAIISIGDDGLNNMFADCHHLNIQKGSGTQLFFTCPNIAGTTRAVEGIFRNTAGYKADPITGETFYY